MPRGARLAVPGLVYHVTQRGNYQQVIFCDDNDRRWYLLLIEEYRTKCRLDILAYCLMDNHVHFIVKPEEEDSMAKCFSQSHMRYAQYFNKKTDRKGHLWQGRFYSCVLDTGHLWMALRYVECNPARAGMVNFAWMWPWSSAQEHISKERGLIILGKIENYIDVNEWQLYLQEKEDEGMLEEIRRQTRTGRVLGSEDFVKELEQRLNLNLKAPKMGRPCKEKK